MAKSGDTISNFISLQDKIQQGTFAPIYLLHGDEPYFIDSLAAKLENSVLPVAERSFNQSVLYGRDVKMQDLLAMARRYPMMSAYQLIIVKEAQELKEWDKLETYALQPLQSTVLVFCFKNAKFDMRTKIAKAIAKYEVFHAEKLRDYQVKKWIPDFVKSKGRSIDGAAVDLLTDFLGTDLSVVHNELEKIFVTIKEDFIKLQHIEENVGMTREYNVFELQAALGSRNFNKSVQIAHHMGFRIERGELLGMVSVLHKFFSRVLQFHGLGGKSDNEIAAALGVNAFFLKDFQIAARNYRVLDLENVFNHLKLLDLQLKGIHRGSAEDGELLVETIVRILKN